MVMHYAIGEIHGRLKFPYLLLRRELTGMAVEVGTHRAEFAEQFAEKWPGKLYCVDPWKNPPGYEHQSKFLWGGDLRPVEATTTQDAIREDDFEFSKKVLEKYGERVVLMRSTSVEAVKYFANKSLDFVYVDGDHSEHAVMEDLTIWWPKLKSGGIIAGHDVVMNATIEDNWGIGIQKVLRAFAGSRDVVVYLVPEEGDLPWSYYMVKA